VAAVTRWKDRYVHRKRNINVIILVTFTVWQQKIWVIWECFCFSKCSLFYDFGGYHCHFFE